MSTATCVLPSPRALASIAPGGPADPDPPNHTTPTHLALGADSTLPTLLAQPRRLARPGASSAIPIATPGAPPASDFFSSPAVAHLSSSPAGGSRATPSGSASNPFGALGDVDDLLGGLGAPSTTGPGSSAARRGAPMVSSPSATSNDFLSGGGGGPGPVSGDDPLLGAVFGDGGDSGPSSSVVAAGGSSAHLSSAGELSPAGGSSNDLLGDLFGGASAGGSGQSSPSPTTPRTRRAIRQTRRPRRGRRLSSARISRRPNPRRPHRRSTGSQVWRIWSRPRRRGQPRRRLAPRPWTRSKICSSRRRTAEAEGPAAASVARVCPWERTSTRCSAICPCLPAARRTRRRRW